MKNKQKQIIVSLLSLILLVAAFGCAAPEGSDKVSNVKPVKHKVGETVSVDLPDQASKYDLTVNYLVDAWSYPKGAPGGEVSPMDNFKLVLVNMSVSNPELNFAAAAPTLNSFTLMADGTERKPIWFLAGSGRDQFPNELEVKPGESETKEFVFEVPAETDLSEAEFIFGDMLNHAGAALELEKFVQ